MEATMTIIGEKGKGMSNANIVQSGYDIIQYQCEHYSELLRNVTKGSELKIKIILIQCPECRKK